MHNIHIEISSDEISKLVDTVVETIREDHFDDLSDKIYESVIDEVKDNINDWIDLDDLEIESNVTNTIEDLLGQFNPGVHCGMGRAVEDIIKDGFAYAIENDDDFARKVGSFIDKWIWKPSDEKHPEDSIRAILGREDASNIHDLSSIYHKPERKITLTERELRDVIYNTIANMTHDARNVDMTALLNDSILKQSNKISEFLNSNNTNP